MFRKISVLYRRSRWLQGAGIIGLWWGCDALARATGLPLPGGILGMAVLLILLASGRLPAAWVRRGSGGLLDHMLLFFIPATMAVLDHRELFSLVGLKVLAVIVLGTALVMIGTALVVELCMRVRSLPHAE